MKKILIIEDEKILADALSKKLIKSGFKIALAYNGQEGLEKVKLETPDLILLDIVMPVMDGLTMLKELRKFSDVPVIILTNLSDSKKLSEALAAGSYDYLVKADYSMEDVVKKINQVLKHNS